MGGTLTQRAGDGAREDDKKADSSEAKDAQGRLSREFVAEKPEKPPATQTAPKPETILPAGFPNLFLVNDSKQPPTTHHSVDGIAPSMLSFLQPVSEESLQSNYGVKVVQNGERFEYRRDNRLLFDTPANAAGMNTADRILRTAQAHGVEITADQNKLTVKSGDGKQNFTVENSEEGMRNVQRMLQMSRDNHGQFRLNTGLNEYEFYSKDAQGKEIKLFNVGANTSGVDKAQTIFDTAKQYGVQIRSDNFSYSYVRIVNGQEQVMAKTNATPQGLEKGKQELQTYIDNKKTELSQKYNVSFIPAGQQFENVNTRQPTVAELAVLEMALDKSRASITREDGVGRKIFSNGTDLLRRGGIALSPGGANNPAVYQSAIRDDLQIRFVDGTIGTSTAGQHQVEDGYLNRSITITPHEYPTTADAKARGNGETRMTLEGTILHEIAHNAQNNRQYDDAKVAEQTGWQLTLQGWAMRTKDGALYVNTEDESDRPWQKVNAAGLPIGDSSPDARISGDDMAKRAVVRPVTDYFTSPTEMFAEALRSYRQGGYWTEKLYREHRDLYTAAKSFDDMELKDQYGVDQAGNTKFIRIADGTIVENTTENRLRTTENLPPPKSLAEELALKAAMAGAASGMAARAAGGAVRPR